MIKWIKKRLQILSGVEMGKVIEFPQTPENLDRLASSKALLKSTDHHTTDPIYETLDKKK
jgi:hypothetical protein|tara:strand:- start:557 stop:736 length:180 start_codon:yes stop_codon:yes gene_type:complete